MTSDAGPRSLDKLSVLDKAQEVERRVPLVVVGGGAAGVAAASAAAQHAARASAVTKAPVHAWAIICACRGRRSLKGRN